MKKIYFFIFLGLIGLLPVNAQSQITLYCVSGPSGLGLVRIFEEPPNIPGIELKAEALSHADLVAARFISGGAVIGVLPPNVAAKIASSGRQIQAAAVVFMGNLTLLTSDPKIKRIEDLKGKTVAVPAQGATPDYVLRRLLLSRGINPERQIRLNYSLAIPEIAQSLISGRVSTGLLPEPFATIAITGRPSLREVGDIQAEWAAVTGAGNYPMTVMAVDAAFASDRRDVLEAILAACRDSMEWVLKNPAEAGALAEKHRLGVKADVAALAIPRSNYVYIPADEARPSMEALFKVFLEFYPASIGASLPKDGFYWH